MDINYEDDAGRAERIQLMEGLVTDLPPPANQAKLHSNIQWLRISDANPPNWDDHDSYCKGEQRWMAAHMCYDIAAITNDDLCEGWSPSRS